VSDHSLIEISLSGLDDDSARLVTDLFERWGRGGAVVEQLADEQGSSRVKAYLLPEEEEVLRQIEIGLELLNRARQTTSPEASSPHRQLPRPQIRFLAETDWAEAWKSRYEVLRIGRRLVIRPTWRDYCAQAGDLVIALDPGMAFGSGLHPTTRLCLEALEDHIRPGATVLDVGTGSGILAIAAARLGASRVLALDTDPLAVRVAGENIVLNQVQTVVDAKQGTTPTSHLPPPGVDLVLANILAETIVELAPALAASLQAEAILIAGGIITDRKHAVVANLTDNGLSILDERADGDWIVLIAQKKAHI
jgi:ribosomal protein L11 methyltransferase